MTKRAYRRCKPLQNSARAKLSGCLLLCCSLALGAVGCIGEGSETGQAPEDEGGAPSRPGCDATGQDAGGVEAAEDAEAVNGTGADGGAAAVGADGDSAPDDSNDDDRERDVDDDGDSDDDSGEGDDEDQDSDEDDQGSNDDQDSDDDDDNQGSNDDQDSDDQGENDDSADDDSPSDDTPTCNDADELPSCGVVSDQSDLTLPLWTLVLEDAAWDELHADVNADVEVNAEVCVGDKLIPIGLEIQGASSRRLPKKNYKLKFNRGFELDGAYFDSESSIDEVVIKAMATDRFIARETLAFELWRQMGHEAPRESFLNLQVNDRYHGVYVLVEPVDKDYLRRRDIVDIGRLYKAVRKYGSYADFYPGRNLADAFEDHYTPDAPNYEVLQELVDLIQDEDIQGEDFAEAIEQQLFLDEYIDRMIWVSFTQNGDAVAQNFFLYYLPLPGIPPWRLIPWDSNLCFGADWADADGLISFSSGFWLDGGNLLAERILEVDSLRDRFVARYWQLLDSVFHEDSLQDTFEVFADQVQDDLRWDQERWGYSTDPDDAVGAVEDFLQQRPELARDRISDF